MQSEPPPRCLAQVKRQLCLKTSNEIREKAAQGPTAEALRWLVRGS